MKKVFLLAYRWHQYIGIYISVAVVLWGLTGLAHPIITRLNPQPVVFSSPSESLTWMSDVRLSDLLHAHEIYHVSQLRVFSWNGDLVVRVVGDYGVKYLSVNSQSVIDGGEEKYAEYLARFYSGDFVSAVKSIKKIQSFDDEYLYINRLLPVIRVTLDRNDGLTVYVDTDTGRLGTLSNQNKFITGTIFRYIHSLVFISSEFWRTAIMLIFLIAAFLVSAVGLWLYYSLWRRSGFNSIHPMARRVHRSLGACVAIAAMAFSVSGGFHIWHKWQSSVQSGQVKEGYVLSQNYIASNLVIPSAALESFNIAVDWIDIRLVTLNDQAHWRIQKRAKKHHSGEGAGHQHHMSPLVKGSEPVSNVFYIDNETQRRVANGDERHALYLASRFSGLGGVVAGAASINVSRIDQFNAEYGFVNKRLPVFRVVFPMAINESIYIENSTQTLVAIVDSVDRLEGALFSNLHKWHFLDFLGRGLRDFILSIFALLVSAVFMLGMWRYWRK